MHLLGLTARAAPYPQQVAIDGMVLLIRKRTIEAGTSSSPPPVVTIYAIMRKLFNFSGSTSSYFFFINLFYLFFLWLCWVFIAARGLSLVAASMG